MICVSVMLAIFLAWPMVFGSAQTSTVRAAAGGAAATAAAVAAPGEAQLVKTAVKTASPPAVAQVLESCFKRYEREYAQCGATNSSCRMKVADQWDMCEATGFWPR